MTPQAVEPHRGRLLFAGITTVDLVQAAAELPRSGQKGAAESSYLDVGGPAANAAVTASILGAPVSLATVIGVGRLAGVAREELRSHGVDVAEQPSDTSLPVSSIWVESSSGERTILAADNRAARVGPLADSLMPAGTVAVLLDGHYADLALEVAHQAHAAGIPIVLDCGRWRPAYAELLPLATDVIACATFRPPDLVGVGAQEALREIQERWAPSLCAFTRGGDSILVATPEGSTEVAVAEVAVVDTLGAGDVLHGAYLYYRYGAGGEPLESLARSAALATESCRYPGARRAVLDVAGRGESG